MHLLALQWTLESCESLPSIYIFSEKEIECKPRMDIVTGTQDYRNDCMPYPESNTNLPPPQSRWRHASLWYTLLG